MAFRHLPIRLLDICHLGFILDNLFFYERFLPFGLRTSPRLFHDFLAHPAHWILRFCFHIWNIFYGDDYFFAEAKSQDVWYAHRQVRKLFEELGILLKDSKYTIPSTEIIFLGIIIDSVRREVRLPRERLLIIRNLLDIAMEKKKITRRSLESLVGVLAHACRAVRSGRTFIQRLRELSVSVKHRDHFIRFTFEAKQDLKWWHSFMEQWNGVSIFKERNFTHSSDDLFQHASDASGTIGFGAHSGTQWFAATWKDPVVPSFIRDSSDICVKELFAIAVAANTFGGQWRGKSIIFYCDNKTSVDVFYAERAHSKGLNAVLRSLHYVAAIFEFQLTVKHIPGKLNWKADALSRQRVDLYRKLDPCCDSTMTTPRIQSLRF